MPMHAAKKVFLALNTYPQAAEWRLVRWQEAVDHCAQAGVDAVILADAGLMRYASRTYPRATPASLCAGFGHQLRGDQFLHHEDFGYQAGSIAPRAVAASSRATGAHTPVEIELFGFGGLCVMVEGRYALSSYITGESPNTAGVRSPAKAVRWQQTPQGLESRLNGGVCWTATATTKTPATRPRARGASMSTAKPITRSRNPSASTRWTNSGDDAHRHICGQDRGPPAQSGLRRAGDKGMARGDRQRARNAESYAVEPAWMKQLNKLAEGQHHTLGAYHRPWK